MVGKFDTIAGFGTGRKYGIRYNNNPGPGT
jgi:hypothetical protein